MKKAVRVIGTFVLACVLVAGGYMAGQKVQLSGIISAMPKHTIDKQPEGEAPQISEKPDVSLPPAAEPMGGANDRIITKTETSAVDETWSEVSSSKNAETGETLTLYTSAEKDGDEFIWDDTQKWVLELSDGNGGYYTLYDQKVTNGNVYFETLERENGEKIVCLYTLTGAGTSVMQYTRTDSGFTEKDVYNSGAVNRTFTSVPAY